MKVLHRIKAIAAYNGARTAIKEKNNYASYILLKEAARGVLSYIVEDSFDKEICEKTKLTRLISWMHNSIVPDNILEDINKLVVAESNGLQAITSMDLDDLIRIKRAIKRLIIDYLNEPV